MISSNGFVVEWLGACVRAPESAHGRHEEWILPPLAQYGLCGVQRADATHDPRPEIDTGPVIQVGLERSDRVCTVGDINP